MIKNIIEFPKSVHSKVKIDLLCDNCGCEFLRRWDVFIKSKEKFLDKHLCKTCALSVAQKRINKKLSKEHIEKLCQSRKKPFFTIICGVCQKEMLLRYGLRKRLYCSRSCQSRAIKKTRKAIKRSVCTICEKEFEHYGHRVVCSMNCNKKYASLMRIGENNPNYKEPVIKKCLQCTENFSFKRDGLHKNQDRSFCSGDCFNIFQAGRSKVLWPQETNYKNPYNEEFKQKRTRIRERDSCLCVLCGRAQNEEQHHVHHIDYDKMNNDDNNLVTLCFRCHMITNCNRNFWQNVFSSLLSGSKIVKKGWGFESHIVNNNDYCLKYLVFFEGKRFSLHTHYEKKELWHCLMGKFVCKIQSENKQDEFIISAGDKIELEPKTVHQLIAMRNSIIVEVSTKDFKEDSHRLVKGD